MRKKKNQNFSIKMQKNAKLFAYVKKKQYFCTRFSLERVKSMAGYLSWLERMIHNHEVPSSILGPATDHS